MGLNCGIVGLPNVGKSTIFNAMTAAGVPAENYPFCTKDHNTGMVSVPDHRLKTLAEIFKPERLIPTQIEFVDIAGLVEGAHKGEGLGNKFLGHIRSVDAIMHVVRLFDAPDVVNSYASQEPIHDIEIINTELALADIEIVTRQFEKARPLAKTGDKIARQRFPLLEKIKSTLESGQAATLAGLSPHEWELVADIDIITRKPVLYVLNVNDSDIKNPSKNLENTIAHIQTLHAPYLTVCGSIEGELSGLTEDEKKVFLDELGLTEPGLDRVVHTTYKLLELITFFTKDGIEVRAWTIKRGTKAPQAAGNIHTDFERGFIRAEVYSFDELLKAGNEHTLKEQGIIRVEGHDYEIRDGDVVHFRFNV